MFIAVPLTSVLQIICANVKILRPIAIIISSGKSYQRESDRQQVIDRYLRKQERRKKSGQATEEPVEEEMKEEVYKGDFILPENFGEKR